MDTERIEKLRKEWEDEEKIAHIHGWDFSHIHGRYDEEDDLPWDYRQIIDEYLTDDMKLLDFDTGGGEFLLSLGHPYGNTAATEGFPPNVELCKETLLPLGIDFKPCDDESNIPFADNSFDIFINRHGSFDPKEAYRILKPGGVLVNFDADYYTAMENDEEQELPENHAHKLVPDYMHEENEAITMEVGAYQQPRPQCDVQLLIEAGFERISVDVGIWQRIYAEIDEFYNPVPIFTIAAYK